MSRFVVRQTDLDRSNARCLPVRRAHWSACVVRRSVAVIALFAAWGIAWAQQQPSSVTPETPLIKGSEVTVTVADYQQGLLALLPEQQRLIEKDPNRLRELLFEIYVERVLERKARQQGLDKQPHVEALFAQAPRKILVDAIVEQERSKPLPQADFTALAEEYYLTHKKDYAQPERVQVAHILWSLKCECEDSGGLKHAQAETVLKELRAGADFNELAKKYSEDKKTAANGGNLGQWFTRGILAHPFEEAAFSLSEPGALSEVVKTDYGYHIIKLIAHQPADTQPFEQVKERIIEDLTKKYRSGAHKAFVGQYYPTAEQFNNAAINALASKSP